MRQMARYGVRIYGASVPRPPSTVSARAISGGEMMRSDGQCSR